MARKQRCKVFVSYSRHDEALVRGLVGFMKLGTDEIVFMDVTSLEPGDEWQKRIEKAIEESLTFVVCWCCKTAKSRNVSYEIRLAVAESKRRIVPVLLCSSPLPKALASRQWQDLRGRIVHECEGHQSERPPERGRARAYDSMEGRPLPPAQESSPDSAGSPEPSRDRRKPTRSVRIAAKPLLIGVAVAAVIVSQFFTFAIPIFWPVDIFGWVIGLYLLGRYFLYKDRGSSISYDEADRIAEKVNRYFDSVRRGS